MNATSTTVLQYILFRYSPVQVYDSHDTVHTTCSLTARLATPRHRSHSHTAHAPDRPYVRVPHRVAVWVSRYRRWPKRRAIFACRTESTAMVNAGMREMRGNRSGCSPETHCTLFYSVACTTTPTQPPRPLKMDQRRSLARRSHSGQENGEAWLVTG